MPIGGVGISSTDAVGWSIGDGVGIQGEDSLESLIYNLLTQNAAVVAVASTRIYLGMLPANVTLKGYNKQLSGDVGVATSDAVGWVDGDDVGVAHIQYGTVLFTRVLGEPQLHMTDRPNKQRATIQIDCMSTSYLTSFELSTTVHAAMQGSTSFSNIQLSNQDLSQPVNNNKMLYRISQDYSCRYKT